MIFVIDNYDSFTYNLVQIFGALGAELKVARSDAFSVAVLDDPKLRGLVISPGPGRPEGAGLSMAAIQHVAGRVPVLGVCLGLQAIVQVYGGRIIRATPPMHGKVSDVQHCGEGLFQGLPNPFTATRYHSLIAARDDLPEDLIVTAWTEEGTIMGVRHTQYPVYGVQFHPESCLTASGEALLANFLRRCDGLDEGRAREAASGRRS